MNSQQELLDAINTISQKQDRSYDTPATVLRVEDDTVWVHIDGGADETPVRKTISCEQGETVQVRISNGSAFLVGNASAPPTDDKTANVAHFVAEQADIKATDANVKATEAKETVEVLEVEVEGKVDSGDSNIQSLSSTMYQNANGVNIFNDSLAVGDSYAHIDGDEFCIREVTSAGVIDDVNDAIMASFGVRETVLNSIEETVWGDYLHYIKLSNDGIKIGKYPDGSPVHDEGWVIDDESIHNFSLISMPISIKASTGMVMGSNDSPYKGVFNADGASFTAYNNNQAISGASIYTDRIGCAERNNRGGVDEVILQEGNVMVTGDVYAYNNGRGYKKTPTILESTTITAATTSYTFTDNRITADSNIEVFDEIDGFEYNSCTASAGSCVITFDAQSTSHKIKLFVW